MRMSLDLPIRVYAQVLGRHLGSICSSALTDRLIRYAVWLCYKACRQAKQRKYRDLELARCNSPRRTGSGGQGPRSFGVAPASFQSSRRRGWGGARYAPSAMNDIEFTRRADAFMNAFMDKLNDFDPDELDADLAMGVLSMEFADSSKAILNRQTAAHQIWLASGVSAWHFAEAEDGQWMCTKGRGSLESVLSAVLTERLGRPIQID